MNIPAPPPLHVKRIGPTLLPDPSRVLMRPFRVTTPEIADRVVRRVLALPDAEMHRLLEEVLGDFADRHHAVTEFFERRCGEVLGLMVPGLPSLSSERRALVGAYFTHEYSPESAALFNPSIVPHPDQSGLPRGALRFILSLRATGEGHISSITFRVGTVSAQHRVTLQTPVAFVTEPRRVPNAAYAKELFTRKLDEAGVRNQFARAVLAQLGDSFTLDELRRALAQETANQGHPATADRAIRGMRLLAESNYEVRFDATHSVAERVIFPSSPSQSNGIEDARFVRFQDDDGAVTYYATYTAYDGKIILPQLLETADFVHFKFSTLNGPAAQNKGMALFPRRIDGRYAMLSRQDDENILLMFSDNLHFWDAPVVILTPAQPWEFVKIGNCGSPIETDAGWLVLSHGVGAMRKYCLGAFLLDRDDPTRVIGRLRRPLLTANEAEREGYVPNVIYTCGAILHRGELVIPYAMSDSATSFATVPLDELLGAME